MKWFWMLFRPTVGGVLKNFHRTIAKLEHTKEWHDRHADECSQEMKVLAARRDESEKEALQADTVAAKLRAIVGI